MPKIDSYLFFDGNCAEAMRFYEHVLGAKIEMMMSGAEAPDAAKMPPGSEKKIIHARLNIDGRALMASDWMSDQRYEGMKGFSLSLIYPTAAEARRIFDVLVERGKVNMPMQKTFWTEAFGMLVDRYGTPWMISGGATT